MSPEHRLLQEITHKYAEWLEHDMSLLVNILIKMVLEERDLKEYYKRILDVRSNTTNT